MNTLQLAKYYPPVYGGIELVEKMMTKALIELKTNVVICAFSSENKKEIGLMGEIIYRIREDFNLMNAPFNLKFIFQFESILKDNKINKILIHLPNPFMHEVLWYNRKYIKKNKIEIIAIYHSDIVNKKIFGSLYNLYFKLKSNIYDKWVVSSENLWNSSSFLRKIEIKKKVVIPFCIEEGFSKKGKSSFSNKLLSIGRFVPYKGFRFLIEALNGSDFELHIIGDGPLKKSLEEIADKNIFFHYEITDDEKNKLFNEVDILVVGSNSNAEAYGMTIVEALSRGVPVIAGNLETGVSYLVQPSITGLLYKVGDKNDFLRQLDLLKMDNDLYNQLSKNCIKFFDDNLSFEKFKNNMEKL